MLENFNVLNQKTVGAVISNHCLLDGPQGNLEAIINIPKNSKTFAHYAVICHPHPLHEGSMSNKIVHTIAKTLTKNNIPSVQFNFRGVGKSEGEFDNAIGEQQDLIAVEKAIHSLFPQQSLYLAGFSFGAYVALHTQATLNAEKLILVAPPIRTLNFSDPPYPTCPCLLIQGLDDDVIDSSATINWAENSNADITISKHKNVGHFFHGHLVELSRTIESFI